MKTPSIQTLAALISLAGTVEALAGCGENATTSDDVAALERAVTAAPKDQFLEGSDMQGPGTAAAREKCKNRLHYTDVNSDRYKACVNMMMAKYHADSDKSFTFEGTLIRFADSDGLKPKSDYPDYPASPRIGCPRGDCRVLDGIDANYSYSYLDKDSSIEAIWGVNGALCLSNPRWNSLYETNKPPLSNLPDCHSKTARPWAGDPFTAGGVIVSFNIAQKITLKTYKHKTSGAILTTAFTPPDGFEKYADIGLTYRDTVYAKDPASEATDNKYIQDKAWVELYLFQGKRCKSGLPIEQCQPLDIIEMGSITATWNLYGDSNLSMWWDSVGQISTVQRPEMIELITYYDKDSDRFFTTTEEVKNRLGLPNVERKHVGGYIYPLTRPNRNPASP